MAPPRSTSNFSQPDRLPGLPLALCFSSSLDPNNPQLLPDSCSLSKIVSSRCFIDHNSHGKLVKKCEKTEQLLRHCFGKPQEILETKTEYTEEDAPNGWALDTFGSDEGKVPFNTPSLPRGPPEIPSLPSRPYHGMDPFSKGLADGFDSFIQAAEEMMNDVFNQLPFYRRDEHNDADFRWSFKTPSSSRQGRKWGGGGSPEVPSSPPENSIPPEKPNFSNLPHAFEEV